jgi:hypothetical protein
LSIYCDEESRIDEAIEDMSDRIYDNVRAEVEQEFLDKGYVWPPKVPALLNEIKQLLTDEGLNKHQRMVDRIDAALEVLKIAD